MYLCWVTWRQSRSVCVPQDFAALYQFSSPTPSLSCPGYATDISDTVFNHPPKLFNNALNPQQHRHIATISFKILRYAETAEGNEAKININRYRQTTSNNSQRCDLSNIFSSGLMTNFSSINRDLARYQSEILGTAGTAFSTHRKTSASSEGSVMR